MTRRARLAAPYDEARSIQREPRPVPDTRRHGTGLSAYATNTPRPGRVTMTPSAASTRSAFRTVMLTATTGRGR